MNNKAIICSLSALGFSLLYPSHRAVLARCVSDRPSSSPRHTAESARYQIAANHQRPAILNFTCDHIQRFFRQFLQGIFDGRQR